MKSSIKSIIVLVGICTVMTVLLALVNGITAPIIQENQNAAANAALLAIQMLAIEDVELAAKLDAARRKGAEKVLAKNAEIEAKYNH